MGTDDLLTWLREQIDEDERVATGAAGGWITKGPHPDDRTPVGSHMARWDPARALREVEVKRRILDLAALAAQHEAQNADDPVRRLEKALAKATAPALGRVLRLLALPYSDRPGYRQEWAPGDG